MHGSRVLRLDVITFEQKRLQKLSSSLWSRAFLVRLSFLYRVINKMVRRYRRGGVEDETKEEEVKIEETTKNSMPEDPETSSDEEEPKGGRRRRTLRIPKGVHVKAKTLKRMLKSKGLKTTGKKSTLRARARKAHLIRGGGK